MPPTAVIEEQEQEEEVFESEEQLMHFLDDQDMYVPPLVTVRPQISARRMYAAIYGQS